VGHISPVITLLIRFIGCEGCRSRKKKCDKVFPNCSRCVQLHIVCEWPRAGPSLRDRRRGLGSLKSRQEVHWTPKPILPIVPVVANSVKDQSHQEDAKPGLRSESLSVLPQTTQMADYIQIEDDWWLPLDFEIPNSLQSAISNGHLDVTTEIPNAFSLIGFQDLDLFVPNGGSNHSVPPVISHISRSLSGCHLSLPNSLTFSVTEHQAIAHYETVFSLYRATKDPHWSTHKVLLRLGSHNAMVMHFVLAVSLNDFSSRTHHNASFDDAQIHFEAGAQLLIQANKDNHTKDHVAMLSSFFFLYLYMLNRGFVATQRLRHLSMTVLDYMKTYSLSAQCLIPRTTETSEFSSKFTSRECSLLARLIIWIFHEDLKCGFQNSGGYLAKYLADNRTDTANIYEISRNVLELQWGEDYPDYQIVDDIENSDVLEFLYAMMPLHQDINELCQETGLSMEEMKSSVQERFSILEKV
jgi:hypothetical protein